LDKLYSANINKYVFTVTAGTHWNALQYDLNEYHPAWITAEAQWFPKKKKKSMEVTEISE